MTKNLSTKEQGDAAEDQALRYLEAQGLRLLVRNYRTPGRGGGEIDLIMQAPEPSGKEPTTVFVEVRQRSSASHGGAAASISRTKQKRIILAARHYLMRLSALPPCRFDVVVIEPTGVQWLRAAFEVV
jgi:putative endonuclease